MSQQHITEAANRVADFVRAHGFDAVVHDVSLDTEVPLLTVTGDGERSGLTNYALQACVSNGMCVADIADMLEQNISDALRAKQARVPARAVAFAATATVAIDAARLRFRDVSYEPVTVDNALAVRVRFSDPRASRSHVLSGVVTITQSWAASPSFASEWETVLGGASSVCPSDPSQTELSAVAALLRGALEQRGFTVSQADHERVDAIRGTHSVSLRPLFVVACHGSDNAAVNRLIEEIAP